MSNLKETLEKIKSLEVEKQNLLAEIEGLKKAADEKAAALENEVTSLREEAKSLKSLMGQETQGAQVNQQPGVTSKIIVPRAVLDPRSFC